MKKYVIILSVAAMLLSLPLCACVAGNTGASAQSAGSAADTDIPDASVLTEQENASEAPAATQPVLVIAEPEQTAPAGGPAADVSYTLINLRGDETAVTLREDGAFSDGKNTYFFDGIETWTDESGAEWNFTLGTDMKSFRLLVNPRGDTVTVYLRKDGAFTDGKNTYAFDGADTWTDENGAEWNEAAASNPDVTAENAADVSYTLINLRGDETAVTLREDGAFSDGKTVYTFDGIETWTDESGAEWNFTLGTDMKSFRLLVNPRGDNVTVYLRKDGAFTDGKNTYVFDGIETWTDENGAEWNEAVR